MTSSDYAIVPERVRASVTPGRRTDSISTKTHGLADLGAMALAGSPADFGKLIADETKKKWSNPGR
jgi:hypothetical protein